MRRRIYTVNINALEKLLTLLTTKEERFFELMNWPDDAKIMGVQVDIQTHSILLAVESQTFSALPLNGTAPITDFEFKVIYHKGRSK